MTHTATGVLRGAARGRGSLVDPTRPGQQILVPAKLVREHQLVDGAAVTGPIKDGRQGSELAAVDSICGLAPGEFRDRPAFEQLVAIDPCQRFHLASSGVTSMRVVDLAAPIGRGTRGLIVSPPKAGKTMLLEQLASAIRADDPGITMIALLIDERPEEVTFFRREVDATVFATSSDQSLQEHMALSELMLAYMRTELECGRDVVVLLDSLTRMTRVYNLRSSSRSRSLSGGLEAAALEIPRRVLGLARNIEHGGSVTILATVLVDTGSRLDQVVYEEFAGTGNSELVLDRSLAEARLFPAIHLAASGTRKVDLLYGPEQVQQLAKLRRVLASRKPREAMNLLLQLLERFPTNEELLRSISLES